MRLVLVGDAAAFATLYRANVDAIGSVVRGGIANAETAADVVQDVLVKGPRAAGQPP